jgi:hypothetical protein
MRPKLQRLNLQRPLLLLLSRLRPMTGLTILGSGRRMT